MNRLQESLCQRRFDRLIADAELIHDWPDQTERLDAACRLIRRAMYLGALGHGDRAQPNVNVDTSITDEEFDQVFRILAFDVPPVSKPTVDRWDAVTTLP